MPDRLEREGDEHRVLAADVIRDPAEERTCEPVQHAVDRQREGQRGQRHAEDAHRHVGHLESLAIGASCAVAIKPPAATITNISVHDPEHRRPDISSGRVVAPLWATVGGLRGDLARAAARAAASDSSEDHQALRDAEAEEGRLVAARLDHGRSGHRQRGARAEAGGGQPRGQPAPVREPLERVAHAGAVDRAGANAADRRGDIEQRRANRPTNSSPRRCRRGCRPPAPPARAEAVDEVALDRHQPRLGEHEDA